MDAASASDQLRRFCFVSSAGVYGHGNPEDWASPTVEARTVRRLLEAIHEGRTPPRFAE
ncbi:hypothetical protein ACFV98_16565 [Streptomyces violascens]|uniref:hypothetical protein n=1 Tax=Streptomyces violascens TaxID=67381 RepID=UPI003662F464